MKWIIFVTIAVIVCGGVCIPLIEEQTEHMESNQLYVFAVMGQSNSTDSPMFGSNLSDVRESVPLIPQNQAYYYGLNSTPYHYPNWEQLYQSYSMQQMILDGQWRIYGTDPAFASTFYNETGQKCMMINVGIGGIMVSSLLPGGDSNIYAKTLISDALSKIPDYYDVHMESIIWIQGESDSWREVADYKSKFTAVWDDFREEYGFKSILISKTRSEDGGNASIAQEELSGSNGVYLATSAADTFTVANGLLTSDNIHYTQKGRDIIAKDVAEYYCNNLYTPYESTTSAHSILSMLPLIIILSIVSLAAYGVISTRRD